MADSSRPSLLESAYLFEKTRPHRVWMTQPTGGGNVEEYTWSQAFDQIRRMAAHLISLDLPPKSQIAIVSKNCAHFILADLAIFMAGHVSVALYPTLNADTVQYILEHSESKLLFVGKLDTWDEMKSGVPEDMPCIAFPLAPQVGLPAWDDIIAEHEPLTDDVVRERDEMAIIIYTSGSTGRPKGVMISFANMADPVHGLLDVFPMEEDDRILSYLPLAHAMERWAVEMTGLVTGAHLFFADSLDTFLEDLRRARPTIFISVPRLWLKFQLGVFAKMPPGKLSLFLKIPILNNIVRKKILTGLGLEHARYVFSGSAPIPADLISWYGKLGLQLLEAYGMTENFCYSHMSLPGKARVGYVGNVYPDADHKISAAGEILVKSPGTMMGYYKEPEMTAAAMTDDGYLKTGDRGEIDSAGRLKITGRVKELFKTSKGKYVAPAPIENLINSSSKVELSCVSGSGRPKPYAVVMLAEDVRKKLGDASVRDELTAELKALLGEVNTQVEEFERLGFIAVAKGEWVIENGFLTPTMKIKRNVIEDTYTPLLDAWYDSGDKIIWQD